MAAIRGKSLKALVQDIAEGYVTVNPLFLKPFDREAIGELYQQMMKVLGEIRSEEFPHGDAQAIRLRNMKLQRLHLSATIIKNYAREKKLPVV